jgi:hypothetical protein
MRILFNGLVVGQVVAINPRKKTQRLYCEGGLTVRKRKGRKPATGMRGQSWSRRGRTPAGRSTSSATSFRTGSASASST